MDEGFNFYICNQCRYVESAAARELSSIPDYCPRCRADRRWSGPFNTETHTMYGAKIEREKKPR